jgi:primosomal replication protein N
MDTKETLDKIKTDLHSLQEKGHAVLNIEALKEYITALQKDSSVSVEFKKLQHQSSLAQYDAKIKAHLEMFKSVINAGKEALNATLLINGGAAVACLGFLGSMLSKGGSESLGLMFTVPLAAFGFGVLSGALGFGMRYCAQFFYARLLNKTGHTFNIGSIFLAACAYVLFGYGVYSAYLAFVTHYSR